MPESNTVEEQEIGLVSVDYFFSYLLPRIPEDKSFSVEAVMADQERKGCLVDKNGKLTWACLAVPRKRRRSTSFAWSASKRKAGLRHRLVTTRNAKLNEDESHKSLKNSFDEMVDSARRVSGNKALATTHSYRMEPRSQYKSDRNENMRPDACFVRGPTKKNRVDRTSWFDIACVGQFKTAKKKDEKDVS